MTQVVIRARGDKDLMQWDGTLATVKCPARGALEGSDKFIVSLFTGDELLVHENNLEECTK